MISLISIESIGHATGNNLDSLTIEKNNYSNNKNNYSVKIEIRKKALIAYLCCNVSFFQACSIFEKFIKKYKYSRYGYSVSQEEYKQIKEFLLKEEEINKLQKEINKLKGELKEKEQQFLISNRSGYIFNTYEKEISNN